MRARQAKRIGVFGTSFGISTIYLAVALRDGAAVNSPEPNSNRPNPAARQNLSAAGLADIVDIRVGDPWRHSDTASNDNLDLVLLDEAFSCTCQCSNS